MNILYMGTPQFAIAPLQALLEAGHTVKAVICQPDKPKGRGHKMLRRRLRSLRQSTVFRSYSRKRFRDEEFFGHLQDLNPEIIVVAAYGKLLPKTCWNIRTTVASTFMPPCSRKYRGATTDSKGNYGRGEPERRYRDAYGRGA